MKILNKFCATWRSWWTETCQRSSRRRRKGQNRRAAACPRLTRWQNGRRPTPLSPSPASNFPAYQTPPPPPLHGLPRPQPPHWVRCPHPDHPCGRLPTNAGDQESRWGRGATQRSQPVCLLFVLIYSQVACGQCGWMFDNANFLQLHRVLMHSRRRETKVLVVITIIFVGNIENLKRLKIPSSSLAFLRV